MCSVYLKKACHIWFLFGLNTFSLLKSTLKWVVLFWNALGSGGCQLNKLPVPYLACMCLWRHKTTTLWTSVHSKFPAQRNACVCTTNRLAFVLVCMLLYSFTCPYAFLLCFYKTQPKVSRWKAMWEYVVTRYSLTRTLAPSQNTTKVPVKKAVTR